MAQFLLHTGCHFGWSPDGKNPNHQYNPGDIVNDDKVDLAASYPEKFAYPGRTGAVAPETPELLEAQIKELTLRREALMANRSNPQPPGGLSAEDVAALDKMDLDQLKGFAEDEEVDLANFKPSKPSDKANTLKELRAYVKSKVSPAQTPAAGS